MAKKKTVDLDKKPEIPLFDQIQFESGAVRQFPLDKIYFKSTPNEIGDILQVAFTCRHNDSHISIGIFFIDSHFGELLEVDLDYNIAEAVVSDYFSRFEQQDPSTLPSYVRLIEDAARATLAAAEKLPENYFFGKYILPAKEEWINLSDKAAPLAHFQEYSWPSPDPEELFNYNIYRDMDNLSLQTVRYDPKKYAVWTPQQWTNYFNNGINSKNLEETFNQKLLPAFYFYEKILMDNATILSKTEQALKRLAKTKPRYTENMIHLEYVPSSAETLYQTVIKESIPYKNFDDNSTKIMILLNDLHSAHPKNPYFQALLCQGFLKIGQYKDAFNIAMDFYEKLPKNPLAIAAVIHALAFNNYVGNILFDKALLLDAHIGANTPYGEADFHNYYLSLAGYLISKNQYPAAWKLYKIMHRFPMFQSSLLLQQKWQQVLLNIAAEVYTYWYSQFPLAQQAILEELMNKK